jgi:hypothetical protein
MISYLSRRLECDEDKGRFEERLGKIAKAKVSKPPISLERGPPTEVAYSSLLPVPDISGDGLAPPSAAWAFAK